MAVAEASGDLVFASTDFLSCPHGFTGTPFDFSSRGLERYAPLLCRTLERSRLVLMRQIHSATVVRLASVPDAGVTILPDCDGVVCDRSISGVALGVRTADCVPVLIAGRNSIAAVHAGWRGVAGGVVERALELLARRESLSDCRAVLGPCAGGDSYEVGAEVIAEIGERAVAARQGEKYLLDLTTTVSNILRHAGVAAASCGINTMRHEGYHSYRREGPGGGHNLSFICAESD